MKFGRWFLASLVMLLALSGTAALFYYWEGLKNESVKMMQDRLNEIELQRFESEKGNQLKRAAQETAGRFDSAVNRLRSKAEALADARALRRPHTRAADRSAKKKAFRALAGAHTTWTGSLLTDKTGRVLAWTGKTKPPTTIGPTPAFRTASRQRVTAIHLRGHQDGLAHLQLTVPCLTDRGAFLGVMQADIPLTAKVMETISPQGGLITLLVTADGQRLTAGPAETFPKNLGALLGKNLKETEALLKRKTAQHFKAKWENTSYLMATGVTQLPKIRVFTLLEVTGLEQVVGPSLAGESMFSDPVMLIGLGLIVFVSLLLMLLVSGGSVAGIKKLNNQLSAMLKTGERLRPVKAQGRGEWGKLSDLINQVMEQVQQLPAGVAAGTVVDAHLSEELSRVQTELEQLRQTYDQTMTNKQTLQEQVEELVRENQTLQEAPAGGGEANPEAARNLEVLQDRIKIAGELRIQAITSMSDDLKATLMVIKNYISSILSSEEGKITDSQQEFLGVVINKSARLERQINDLLDISHMESGISQMYKSSTDLVSMLQDVVLNSQPQADIKQVKIVQEIQTPLPTVMIDGDRLGQVFIHLLQHAIKTSPVGGEVQITAQESFSDLIVKIRDSGPAVTPEQAARVFTTFHGPDSQAGPDIVGTGLRFPIVKNIVDAHHGALAIRGLSEQGNEIVVTLRKSGDPLAADETPAPSEQPAEAEEKTENVFPQADTDSDYDLASFMGKMEELDSEEPDTKKAAAGEPEEEEGKLPGGGEDLDKLLSDIESIDDNMEK